MDKKILQLEFLGNSLQEYMWFFIIILIGLILKKICTKYLSHLLFKIVGTKDNSLGIDKFNELLAKPLGVCIMLSVIYLGSTHINYPTEWNLVDKNEMGLKLFISKGFSLLYVFSLSWIVLRIIDYISLILHKKASETENKMDVFFMNEDIKSDFKGITSASIKRIQS